MPTERFQRDDVNSYAGADEGALDHDTVKYAHRSLPNSTTSGERSILVSLLSPSATSQAAFVRQSQAFCTPRPGKESLSSEVIHIDRRVEQRTQFRRVTT